MGKGLLIVISGPSGAGKGTICKRLLEKNPQIMASISATTRAPRSGEEEGVNYFFIDHNRFKNMINNDQLLEYAEVYGNYYGTPKKYVIENLEKGNDVLLEIDIEGALQIKEKFAEGIFVFILPPSLQELKSRIINRGTETEEDINTRYGSARGEINQVIKYDYVVINDDVERARADIEAIIRAENCKVLRVHEEIKLRF
ncbi:guanylate kinase [Alkaliphilus pronyensis]|uniref:Guanylate kinase n=1 Tax=Alkaliphilus pronyensis TaxID=1482732 RepID=A0A6I0EZ49_9FIRM|nr:guanylate kinase [Alkaliphilus pronyensis]